MPEAMGDSVYALKARTILPMVGEKASRGPQLFANLNRIDNGIILVSNDRVVACGKARNVSLPADCTVQDLGNVTVIPGPINAHAHLDLSFLRDKTLFAKGFTPWLQSLLPLLPRGQTPEATIISAIEEACEFLTLNGTRHVGNIAGSAEQTLTKLDALARRQGIGMTHFCEWFGFNVEEDTLWPQRVRDDLARNTTLWENSAPAGHALYSTAGEVLQRARNYCVTQGLPFSLHLAESPDETEMLTEGKGPLYELYRETVLQENWKAPGMRPLALAIRLGLPGSFFLAVHGTQLDRQEAQVFALTGSALCLCPRSNHNLGVGLPDVQSLMAENVLLCLGTDGLSSNTDLDVIQEAVFLREHFSIPKQALIRMLTVNGVHALHLDPSLAELNVGSPAKIAILPPSLTI